VLSGTSFFLFLGGRTGAPLYAGSTGRCFATGPCELPLVAAAPLLHIRPAPPAMPLRLPKELLWSPAAKLSPGSGFRKLFIN